MSVLTMSLTPFSRENMRTLKLQKDEEGYQRKLEEVVRNIYASAVSFAERTAETTYRFAIQNGYQQNVSIPSTIPSTIPSNHYQSIQFQITKEFIVGNMDEILSRLRSLFPDCSVEYKKVSMAMGRDGKEYDISNLDEKLRPFIDTSRAQTKEYIIIDWT
jgi:hypothetical protein